MEEHESKDRWWDWFEEHAHSAHALFWLALVSFLEPIVLPLMPEVVMGPLILAKRQQWKKYVLVTISSSIVGGIVGYFLGATVLTLFNPLFAHWGLSPFFPVIQQRLSRHIFFVMFLLMLSPLPDKGFVLLAGFFHVSFIPYVIGFSLGRIMRFTIAGYLVQHYGNHVLKFVREYFEWFAIAVFIFIAFVILHVFHFI
jgi:membrane protein YqaA with SNARE-associated domain